MLPGNNRVKKPADMITIRASLMPEIQDAKALVDFMRIFQAAKRTAYQAIRQGVEREKIIAALQKAFMPNARWCQWACNEAEDTIRGQLELIDMYIHDIATKIEKAKEKLARTKDKLHRQGIVARITRLKTKLARWQQHKANGTVPAAVFGGKKNLIALAEGKLSKEKWRELRANSFTSIGQANQKGLENQYGNANTEIVYREGHFFLNVYIPPGPANNIKTGRGVPRRANDWLTIPMIIPAAYENRLLNHLSSGNAYTVQVLRKDGKFFTHISFALGDEKQVDHTQAMAGIDLNPQNISVTIVSANGNFKTSKVFHCPDLPTVKAEKRNWIIGNLCRNIADWLIAAGVNQVALEELHFNQDHDTNRFFNRMSHNFSHRDMFINLVTRLRKENIAVFTVNPKFTSLIGFVKYQQTYGLAVHQAAALVIARRSLGYKEKLPKELLKALAPKEGQPRFGLWGKLFGIVKHTRRNAIKEGIWRKNWLVEDYLSRTGKRKRAA